MGSEYWKAWAKAAGIRAVKTAAQSAIATIGASAAMGDVNWMLVGSASLLAAILSVLTSIAGLPEVEKPALEVPKGEHVGDVSAAIAPDAKKDE